jgi:hypothetical protein
MVVAARHPGNVARREPVVEKAALTGSGANGFLVC